MAINKSTVAGLVILAGAGAVALYFATRKKTIVYQQPQDTPKPWTFQIPLARDRSYVTAAPAQTQKQAVVQAQISAKTPAANILETDWLANAFKDFSGPAPVTAVATSVQPPVNNYVMADRRNAPTQSAPVESSGFIQSIADSFKPSAPISLLRPANQRTPAPVAIPQKSPGILDWIFGETTGARPSQSFIRPQTTPSTPRPTFAIQTQRPPVDGSFSDSPLKFLESAVAAITEPIRKIVEPIESAPSTSVGGQITPAPISAQERQYGFTGAYTVHGERFLNYKDNGATMSIKASYWANSQDRRGCKWTPNGFVCPSDGAKYDALLNSNALLTKDAPSVYEAFK